MESLKEIWADPVWSKIIAGGILAAFSFIASKYKFKFMKIDRKELFSVLSTEIIQKANYPCITIKFNSKEAVVEFQKIGGKLVGYSDPIGWVRQDCPILQKYMNSWKFKFKRLVHLKHK